MSELPTSRQISKLLGISERSVFNKRQGLTDWTLTEYLLLCKHYDIEIVYALCHINELKSGKEK